MSRLRKVRTLTPDQALDAFVALLTGQPPQATIAQFEAYLEAARRPELSTEITAVLDAFAAPVAAALGAVGVSEPAAAARAFVVLADGFALQRAVCRRCGRAR
jgi:TetR/AcrR family transcriptional regulator, regulator of biofilm formation and stress response